jgi:hypothetical protein
MGIGVALSAGDEGTVVTQRTCQTVEFAACCASTRRPENVLYSATH